MGDQRSEARSGGPPRTPPSLRLWLLHRAVNPLVSAVLRGPLHRLLSGSLLLLTYTRRRDGAARTIPVQYVELDGTLVVFAGRAAEKVWWRNLRSGARVRVRLRGSVRTGLAEPVDDLDAIAALRGAYVERFPRARAADDAVVVRITLEEPR